VHDATFGDGVEIPSISFPVIISRDPEGAFDMGQDGMVAAQMAQQQQFYAAQVMQPGQAMQQVNYGYQDGAPQGAPVGGPPMGVQPQPGQPGMAPQQQNAYPQL